MDAKNIDNQKTIKKSLIERCKTLKLKNEIRVMLGIERVSTNLMMVG